MIKGFVGMLMFILFALVSIALLILGVSEENIVKLACSLIWMFGSGIWFSMWLYEHYTNI